MEQAHISVEEALQTLEQRCTCATAHPRPASGNERPQCLLVLAVTVARLVTLLTSADYSKDLQPTQLGLKHIFTGSSIASRFHTTHPQLKEDAGIQIMKRLGLEVGDGSDPGPLYEFRPLALMTDNIYLFAGEDSLGENRHLECRTAMAVNGICVYMECLQGLSVRPELLRKVHVIPGYIGRGNKVFDSVWDSSTGVEHAWEEATFETAAEPSTLGQDQGGMEALTLTPMVDEPSDGMGKLMFYYQIATPHTRTFVQPGRITENVLRSSGIINCPGEEETCDKPLPPNTYFVRSGWDIGKLPFDNSGTESNVIKVVVWKPRASELHHLTAFHFQSLHGPQDIPKVFLRQDQCLSCSARSAFKRLSLAINRPDGTGVSRTHHVTNVF